MSDSDSDSDHVVLDPQVAERFAHLRGVSVEQYFTVGVEEPPVPAVGPVPGVVWSDTTVDGDTPVPVRRYVRRGASADAKPCLVWCHGGGWGLGHLDMVEAHVVAQRVADAIDAVVYSVDYGLAPAHPYPVPQDQIVDVFGHALGDPDVDPTRVALGGASAGGHLAACAAHRLTVAEAPIAALFLAYPATDPVDGPFPEVKPDECPELLWFDGAKIASLFAEHAGAMPPPTGAVPARLEPVGLPPTLVTTASLDGLGPQAEAYVDLLVAAGVEVEHHEVRRVLHGYLDLCGSVPVADAALDRHLAWLGDALR